MQTTTAPSIERFEDRSDYYAALDRFYASMYGQDDTTPQEGLSNGSEDHHGTH